MDVSGDVDRYVDSVFGFPFLTPGPHEEGMWFAQGAALRSGAPARQVGVALIPKIGTPVVAGTNEVPRPGGGQYWDGDRPDHRDFREGQDPNPNYMKGVVQELLERLKKHDWLVDDKRDLPGPALVEQARQPDDTGSSVLGGARASALIEFTRCLHAEQAAIINAARSGVSTQDAILYSTTFPCHECAKMIIGAGIVEVHYIEPYPKSLVDRLYRHLIDTSPPVRAERGLVRNKVPFYQFLGIAPRRYSRAFTAERERLAIVWSHSREMRLVPALRVAARQRLSRRSPSLLHRYRELSRSSRPAARIALEARMRIWSDKPSRPPREKRKGSGDHEAEGSR